MIVIGLTGGIGSGKSQVSRILEELGATVIDADKVGHEAYSPHTEAWKAIVAEFGRGVIQPNEEVDRKKLGAIVFGDPQKLERLNRIMHPRIYRMLQERLEELRAQGVAVVVVEAAVLIEGGWAPLVDEVWVTTAQEDTVVRRIQARNDLPEEQIRARIRSQMSPEERSKHAQVTVRNDGTLEELRRQVEELWNSRVSGRV